MKILSIISVGRTQSLCGNKLKHFLCFCILPCLLCSCDIWYNLPFTGYAERFIHFKPRTRKSRYRLFHGRNFRAFETVRLGNGHHSQHIREFHRDGFVLFPEIAVDFFHLAAEQPRQPYVDGNNEQEKERYKPVVVDGNIVTSRGLGTAMEFGFKLLELLEGKEKELQIKDAVIYQKLA